MSPEDRWAGIDCGCSQMTLAVVDNSMSLIALERTFEPWGDGHDRDIALARLERLLHRLNTYNSTPIRLAGYCYEHSGVVEAFRDNGWTVNGCKALNDVVGIYGLSEMKGNAIVWGCGSYSQVVYIDESNSVCWPGEDLCSRMPPLLLSGWGYAEFLQNHRWLNESISGKPWGQLGPVFERMVGSTEVDDFLSDAAAAIAGTCGILEESLGRSSIPVIFGGGAVSGEAVWKKVSNELAHRGIDAIRVKGEPSLGLARFAAYNPYSDAWAYIGRIKPSWL